VRQPRARLAWLQGVFAACLLVPLWQPWAEPLAQPLAQPLLEIQVYTTGIAVDQASGSWRWLDLIAGVLCAGVAVRWFWLVLGLLRLRRYRTNAERLSPVPGVIARLQTRLGVQPEFYLSSELASPLTFGIRPAVVLLPTRFAGMPEETQEAIVCHELCHVRRRDWLVTFAEETVRGLCWFHPFVAWLMREMQLMREQVVDRQVVEITGSRQAYVAALVEIASARVHPAIAMAPLFLGKRQITRRVQMLAQEVSMSRVRLAVSLAMMGTILAGTGQLSAWSFPLQSVRPAPAETQYAAEKAKAFADVWNRAERLQVPRDEATVPSRIPMILAAASAQASPSASPQQSTRPSTAEGQDLAEKARAFAEAWELAKQLPNQRRLPRTLHSVIPEYTEEASRLSGMMTLHFEVGIDGQPRNIRVVRSLETSFVEKAVEALQQWRFQPAEKDGKPVAAEAVAMVYFRPARLAMGLYFPMQ